MAGSASRSAAPKTTTRSGWPGSATRLRLAVTSSGASDAQSCHPATTSTAAASGQCSSKRVARGSATVANTREVTTPNCPPPAPRSAQNNSGSRSRSQSTTRPSASTTWALSRASQVSPLTSSQEAEPAAEGEAGDPDRGATAGRHGAAGSVQPVVDLCQACTRADPRAPVGADGDGVEAAQVEDQTRGRRSAGEAMAAAAGYDVRAAVPREGKRARHIPGGGAADHSDRAHVVESGQRWTARGVVRS